MARLEETFHIDAQPDVVWELIRDVCRWAEWTPTVTSIAPIDGDLMAAGSEFRVRQPKLPSVVWTVEEVRPGRSFAWKASSPGVRSRADHLVEPDGDGSRVVLVFEQTGPLAGLSGLFYSRMIRRYVRTEGESLKRAAEKRTGTAR